MNRRHFFLGALSLTSACSHLPSVSRTSPVSVVKASHYGVDLTNLLRRVLVDHKLSIAGKRIVLKPNLVEFSPHLPINTHPVFVAAAAEAFHSLGASSVVIAEGPGHRRATLDMAEAAGFFSAIENFEDHFVDLNLDEVSSVALPERFSTLNSLYLPHTILAADLLVSLPKMKTITGRALRSR